MLPRQTCGLYTHTLNLKDYPRGEKRLRDSIHGGELFQVVINNLVSNQNNYYKINITKNILQCQQVVESLAELSEPIRILSLVIQTFAVIRSLVLMRLFDHSLVLMRLQNCSINSPDHGSFPAAKYECLWTCVSCLKAGGFPSQ